MERQSVIRFGLTGLVYLLRQLAPDSVVLPAPVRSMQGSNSNNNNSEYASTNDRKRYQNQADDTSPTRFH